VFGVSIIIRARRFLGAIIYDRATELGCQFLGPLSGRTSGGNAAMLPWSPLCIGLVPVGGEPT
jgi:hypothetical protein